MSEKLLVSDGRRHTVVAFEMGYAGHLRQMLPVLRSLVQTGARVHLFSTLSCCDEVQPLGVEHHDLFAEGTPDQSDPESWPRSFRPLAFAVDHGEAILRRVAALRPTVILFDNFAFLGQAMAHRLDIPSVCLASGHNRPAATSADIARQFPGQRYSSRAIEAVGVLRDRYGLSAKVPEDLYAVQSPWLNLYGEPPEFLPAGASDLFQPMAFFGSLQPERALDPTPAFRLDPALPHRVLVSFGTINWRFFATPLHETLRAVAQAINSMPDAEALISLGGGEVNTVPGVAGGRVRVASYVDQWSVLTQATALITHHGLNSTHEAIWHQVPMLSAPILDDQPRLARRCQEFGLAIPLAEPRITVPTVTQVREAMERALAQRPAMLERLGEARAWEQRVIAQRPAVIARILALS